LEQKDLVEEERDGKVIYKTGASRSSDIEHLRYDLIPPCALRELAEVFAEGAKAHGDENWKKGMDEGVIVNHAMEHLMKYREGDRSENHLGKIMWACSAMIFFNSKEK
jgi:hypothetical protein